MQVLRKIKPNVIGTFQRANFGKKGREYVYTVGPDFHCMYVRGQCRTKVTISFTFHYFVNLITLLTVTCALVVVKDL